MKRIVFCRGNTTHPLIKSSSTCGGSALQIFKTGTAHSRARATGPIGSTYCGTTAVLTKQKMLIFYRVQYYHVFLLLDYPDDAV